MRRLLTVLTFLTASYFSAAALAAGLPLIDPGAQIENLTPTIVAGLLAELGVQNVEQHNSNGKQIVTFVDAGIPYNLGLVCDASACTGLFMVVGMNTGADKYPLEILNASNKRNALVTVTQEDDKILIDRVLITEGSVSKKNIAINLVTFVGSVQETLKFLTSQLVAGYQQGGPAQYQRASLGLGMRPPRPEFLSPQDMARAMATLAPHHGTSLHEPR